MRSLRAAARLYYLPDGWPSQLIEIKDHIQREQVAGWRTSSMRRSKPSAEDEASNGMMVIEETCWHALPEHYRRLDRALQRLGQEKLPHNATLIKISTWCAVGGLSAVEACVPPVFGAMHLLSRWARCRGVLTGWVAIATATQT